MVPLVSDVLRLSQVTVKDLIESHSKSQDNFQWEADELSLQIFAK